MKLLELNISQRPAMFGVLLCCLGLAAGAAIAHTGRVDVEGCHFLSKPRGEHCHKDRAVRRADPGIDSETARRAREKTLERHQAEGVRLRRLYRYWADADGDCRNTATEVLIRESLEEPLLSRDGCKVIRGRWRDPYSGGVFTDPRQLRVGHLVPVREVHKSGGYKWNGREKAAYANDLSDPGTLVVMYWREKKDRGFKSPADWLPSNKAYHCRYVRSWVRVKRQWKLTADAAEKETVGRLLRACRKGDDQAARSE